MSDVVIATHFSFKYSLAMNSVGHNVGMVVCQKSTIDSRTWNHVNFNWIESCDVLEDFSTLSVVFNIL